MFSRHALALCVLIAAVWSFSIHNGTVNFDTPWLVVENPLLNQGALTQVIPIFTDLSVGTRMVLGAEYLPVRDLTVLLDFAMFGNWWTGHHLVNLLWYMMACVLWLWICRQLLVDPRLAWLAAALYAVHPVHVESVAWLASRKDVVSLAMFFGAVVAWMRGGRVGTVLSVLLFALAYWSKNTAIVLPAILVLVSLLARGGSLRQPRWWLQWIPLGLLAAGGLLVTMRLGAAVSMMAVERADTAWGIVRIEAQVIARYLEMMVAPLRLSVLYTEPVASGPAWPGFLLLAVLLGTAMAAIRSRPLLSLGIGWFFVALLPVSQIIPLQNLMADRYLLLPSAGAILAVVSLLPAAVLRHPAGIALALMVLSTSGVITAQRCMVWRDSVSLWRDVVDKEPQLDRGWAALAAAQATAGDMAASLETLEAGMHLLPDSPLLMTTMGLRMLDMQDPRAEDTFRQALALDPEQRTAANALAEILRSSDRLEESIAVSRGLLQVHPRYAEGWNTLAATCINARQLDCAQEAVDAGLTLAPLDASLWSNRGSVAYLLGDRERARESWTEALRLDPDNAYARRGLAHLRSQ